MEIVKIKKNPEKGEKTVEVDLFGAYIVSLLTGWLVCGIIKSLKS